MFNVQLHTNQGESCVMSGISILQINDYECDCNTGWNGSRCDQDINECNFSNPICENGGSCKNDQGSFTCYCPNANGTYYSGMYSFYPPPYNELHMDNIMS